MSDLFIKFYDDFIFIYSLVALFAIVELIVNRANRPPLKDVIISFVGGILLLTLGTLVLIKFRSWLPLDLIKNSWIENKILYSLAFLFLIDFFYYFYHRLQHSNKFLWGIHKFHHSDSDMNVFTSQRSHFLEKALQVTLIVFPILLIIGKNADANVYIKYSSVIIVMYGHMRIKISHGILTKIITGPALHRVHHSIEREEADSNYAQFFPFIDILFGTYKAPKKNLNTTGIESDTDSLSKIKAMLYPIIQWKK